MIGIEKICAGVAGLFEIIKTMSDHGLLFVSVVDESNKLLGVITTEKIIKVLGQQTSMMEPGGILVLEMKNNYA